MEEEVEVRTEGGSIHKCSSYNFLRPSGSSLLHILGLEKKDAN